MQFSDDAFSTLLDDLLDAAHDGLAPHLKEALDLARERIFITLVSAGIYPASTPPELGLEGTLAP